MVRLARAELFDPSEVTILHVIGRLRTPDLSGKLGGRFLGFLASDQGVS